MAMASKQQLLPFVAEPRPTVETREEKVAREKAEADLQKLMHARLVAGGVNLSMAAAVLDPDSATFRAIVTLRGRGMGSVSETTMRNSMSGADELLTLRIAELLRGKYASIITDAASMRHVKYVAVLLNSLALEAPALLSLIAIDDNGVYDASASAADIREQLTAYGVNLDTQIVGLSGDNASINGSLARELRVPHHKCLPHALALIVKAAFHGFGSAAYVAAVGPGSIVYLGGTAKRAAELAGAPYHLVPTKMTAYMNRFGSVVEVAQYLEDNFGTVSAPRDTRSHFFACVSSVTRAHSPLAGGGVARGLRAAERRRRRRHRRR